jgi:hypothetical protein
VSRLRLVNPLLDALDHFGAHDRFVMHLPQMIGSAPDDFGVIFGFGVPAASWHQTFILLHGVLLAL